MAADVPGAEDSLDAGLAVSFIGELWDDSLLSALRYYIRIPNKSPAFEPNWRALGHM